MIKFIYKTIINAMIGPIVVASLALILLMTFYFPNVSLENQKGKIITDSTQVVDYLKTFRSYYNEFIVSKMAQKSNIRVDYNHEFSSDTIPLPATTIHNLSDRLVKNQDIRINFFSDYPFPNRSNRVLDDFQKSSMEYLRKNPNTFYTKEDIVNGKKVFRVAYPDIMVSQNCINCHNNRVDSPKHDWKLNDVRGVLEVVTPLKEDFVLSAKDTEKVIIFMILVVLAFIVHYTLLYFKKERQLKLQNHQLEDEVQKRTKELNDSNLLLLEHKKAVDASAIVSKADIHGNITYVNKTFCEVSGYTKEELLGKPHNIVRHPDMPKEIFRDLWETIKSKKIFKGIIKNRNKNGSFYYVASTIVPILDKNEEIIEYLSLRYDITELVEARKKAEIAQKSKSTFLANMSHEIRTPLNAIIGFSDILCESNIDNENKENAKIISKSAKSLLKIINDVLDISKMENGKLEVELSEFSLFDLTEYIVELFSINATDKNIKFVYSVDSKLPHLIISDSMRIQQVLSNLLSNAIKFTSEYGKIYFRIEVLNQDNENAKIKFSIKDSGIGMTPEQIKIIFNPFSQADSGISRKFGGTGLGLAICNDIIKLLGSNIEVNSQIGNGSEFFFILDFKVKKSVEENVKKSDISFAICDLSNDEDFIKESVKNYLEKIGEVFDIRKNPNVKTNILFCFGGNNLGNNLLEFKKQNIEAKIVYVGDKNSLDEIALQNIDYDIDLPVYGSKIYNIIADNSNINNRVLTKSSDTLKFKGKVLVAEDNINNQKLIEVLLKKLGIEVTIVSNGLEVVESYKKDKYDLILMDINMPIMDGLTATKEISLIKNEYYDIPIIALTANSIAGDKEKYLSLGMDEYISKPIEFDKLTSILDKYLNNNKNSDISKNENENRVKFDKNKTIERLGLDEDTVDMLLDNFFLTLDSDLQKLQKAIDSKNSEEISKAAHYIKGASTNLGMDEATVILQNIETRALNKEIDFNLKELKEYFFEIHKKQR
ncbi:MAG: response regulator [Aliarcobacter sp.]|nr:response regulator [Aliarcobacter sp.]